MKLAAGAQQFFVPPPLNPSRIQPYFPGSADSMDLGERGGTALDSPPLPHPFADETVLVFRIDSRQMEGGEGTSCGFAAYHTTSTRML